MSITISFLPAGHTKFSPDWCFGLVKRAFRRTVVGSIHDIVDVVNSSAVCNKAQLVGTPEGEVLVPTYDWTGYLAPYFRKIKSLKTYHHFTFESHCLGDILLKTTSQDPVKKERHLRSVDHTVVPSALPPTIQPCGLTNERQWYLFDKIREFCPEQCRDITCPRPTVPRPTSSSCNTPEVEEVSDTPEPATVVNSTTHPMRKQRICSRCGNLGHNIRTCKN